MAGHQVDPVIVRARALALALALLACVFVSSPLHTPLNNPNEGVRVFTVKALVEHGTFAIDEVVREWGYIDDKATWGGRLYSSKAPVASMIGALGYLLLHPFTGDLSRDALTRVARGTLALVCLVPLAIAWRGLRRRTGEHGEHGDLGDLGDLVFVGVVFAVLPLLNVFAGHALAALAPLAALFLLERGTRTALAGAGALLALAVGAEYPALLACAPIGLLVVRPGRRRDIGWLALGALPVVAVVGAAHTAMFGAPWRTGYSALENPQYQKVVEGTLFGIGAPQLDVLGLVTFSPAVGLFWFAPFLLVGLVFVVITAIRPTASEPRDRSEAIALTVATVAMFVFIAGFRGWRGGWSVGPRYISELIGVLALPCALAFTTLGVRRPVVARAALASLVGVTLLHSAIAGAFFPHLPDVFANPVHELMLPLVALGMTPDSPLPLPAAGIVVVLALPLAIAARAPTALGVCAAVTALVVVVAPAFETQPRARAKLEARRMLDNWRPERGNPLIDEPAERDDVRRLVAVDRARVAVPLARTRGCPGPLVIVPDELAFALVDVVDESVLMLTASDVARVKGPLPCGDGAGDGDIAVLGRVPPRLARHRVVRTAGEMTWLARH